MVAILQKKWLDLSKNKQIKYGIVGAMDENYVFCALQDHFDQNYSVAQVVSVKEMKCMGRSFYSYNVGLSQGDFGRTLAELNSAKVAIVGNKLLLHQDKYIMNLTAMENCWNLWWHYGVHKYGLSPSYSGPKETTKHCFKTYKNKKGEIVMPAVVIKHNSDDTFGVFIPQTENEDYYRDIHMWSDGVYFPSPRPSDVVLLKPTTEQDKFVLKDNLTMSVELQNLRNKFGFPQYKAALIEQIKNIYER